MCLPVRALHLQRRVLVEPGHLELDLLLDAADYRLCGSAGRRALKKNRLLRLDFHKDFLSIGQALKIRNDLCLGRFEQGKRDCARFELILLPLGDAHFFADVLKNLCLGPEPLTGEDLPLLLEVDL